MAPAPHSRHFTLGKELVPLAQEGEWALELFWMVWKFSPPTGIWSLNYQVGNKPQYWLHHPGCHCNTGSFSITMGTPKAEIIWAGFHLGFMVSELTHLMLDVVFRNKHIVLIKQAKQWDQFYQSMHQESLNCPCVPQIHGFSAVTTRHSSS